MTILPTWSHFILTLNQPMSPLHTSIWDYPLSILISTEGILVRTVNIFRNQKFNGEGHVFAFTHINHFNIT
jgi:hypothetical protein